MGVELQSIVYYQQPPEVYAMQPSQGYVAAQPYGYSPQAYSQPQVYELAPGYTAYPGQTSVISYPYQQQQYSPQLFYYTPQPYSPSLTPAQQMPQQVTQPASVTTVVRKKTTTTTVPATAASSLAVAPLPPPTADLGAGKATQPPKISTDGLTSIVAPVPQISDTQVVTTTKSSSTVVSEVGEPLPVAKSTGVVPTYPLIPQSPAPIMDSTATVQGASAHTDIDPSIAMTPLQANIKALRDKMTKKQSLLDLLTTDEALFAGIIGQFNATVQIITSSGMDLLASLAADRKTVEAELRSLADFMVNFVQSGRSSTDQDQFRPFSVRTYDSNSQTILTLRMAANSLMALIQSEGFVLAMENLGLLEGFVGSCVLLLKPPFTPTFLNDPVDGDTAFRQAFDQVVNTLNQLAYKLQNSDYTIVATVPDAMLSALEALNTQPYMALLYPRGYREKKAINWADYNIEVAALLRDSRVAYAKAAELTKDILRDVLAEGIADLLLTASKIFLSVINTTTFRTIDATLKYKVVTCLRNLFELQKALTQTTDASGATVKGQRLVVVEKLEKTSKALLQEAYADGVKRYGGQQTGVSLAEYDILAGATQAAQLLKLGAGGTVQKMFTDDAKLSTAYTSAVGLLTGIFMDQKNMQAFSGFKFEDISINQVTDQTIIYLFTLIIAAQTGATTGLLFKTSRGTEYADAFRTLFAAVNANKAYVKRLAQVDPKSAGQLSQYAVKYSSSGIGGIAGFVGSPTVPTKQQAAPVGYVPMQLVPVAVTVH